MALAGRHAGVRRAAGRDRPVQHPVRGPAQPLRGDFPERRLPAYFDDDPAAASLGAQYVRKPLLSREGANIEVHGAGVDEPVFEDGYGAEGWIRQAYSPPAEFDGHFPVVGAWIVGDRPAGIG